MRLLAVLFPGGGRICRANSKRPHQKVNAMIAERTTGGGEKAGSGEGGSGKAKRVRGEG